MSIPKNLDIESVYPKKYPNANDQSELPGIARQAWEKLGGLPVPVTDPKAGTDQYYQKEKGHADVAQNETNNRSMKKPEAKTIGSQVFEGGQDAINFIKKFDPQNTSGSIPFALDLVKQIQSNSGPNKMLSDIVGQGLSSIISKFTQALKEEKSNEADSLSKLIQLLLQLKRQLEELLANPQADPQAISDLQLRIAELEKQIESMNTV
jgi:hypothetical protein